MNQFIQDEEGATAIEYGLIAALVAIIIVAGLMVFRGAMIGMYSDITTTIDGALN